MRRSILAVAVLFLAGGEAAAQTRADLNEVSLSAFLSAVSAGGESSTIMQLESRYGRFLSSRLELGASLSATKVEGIDLFGTLGAFGAWHFGLEGATSVPCAGAGAGFGFAAAMATRSTRPGGGKFFVGESAAVHTELFVNRIDSGTGSGTQYGLRVGLAIFW
jgi:hypothetical protein